MKNLYGTISINTMLGDKCFEENINYYKLKNNKYGFEIVKESNTNDEEIEITNMSDITDNEEKINKVLYDLVVKQIMPKSEDIIEDLIKTYAC